MHAYWEHGREHNMGKNFGDSKFLGQNFEHKKSLTLLHMAFKKCQN